MCWPCRELTKKLSVFRRLFSSSRESLLDDVDRFPVVRPEGGRSQTEVTLLGLCDVGRDHRAASTGRG